MPMTQVQTYRYSEGCPASPILTVTADGQRVFVYRAEGADLAAFGCDGPVEVVISSSQPLRDVRVLPLRRNVTPQVSDGRLTLELPGPMDLMVEARGMPALFLYASALDRAVPPPADKHVRFFRAGQIHEVDELRLTDGQTAYIEGGAVVHGCIRASRASDIRIAGPGILTDHQRRISGRGRRSIILEGCRDGRIEDIVMVEPAGWMVSLAASQGMLVRGIRQIGTCYGSDGVDVVGSRDVRIEGCMLRNGDDCIVVKSLAGHSPGSGQVEWGGDVQNVDVVDCALLSHLGGCAMEIGHETRTDTIRDIRFRNCMVMGVHDYGAAFGIHNSDRAVVQDILFEGIHVEHHYDKLVDFRIIRSRWSKDLQRGQVRNVTLRDIDVDQSPYNPGYTVSLIGGYDPQHTIDHVRFERLRLNGKPAVCPDHLDLYARYASDITFA